MEIPVFLFTGFLESGKTTFIMDTVKDPEFQAGGKTLIIRCEDGTVDYSQEILEKANTFAVDVESEEELTEELLHSLNSQYKPKQVIIEYNGMWNINTILNLKLPRHWILAQILNTIDASMFSMYLTNMKAFLISQVTYADLIVINRCTDDTDQTIFRRNIKAVNRGVQILYETTDGRILAPEAENLNYDLSSGKIRIENDDFGIWYLDLMENTDKYVGIEAEFKAIVYKGRDIPKGHLVLGRFAMTCCADDIRYIGIVSRCFEASAYQQRDWVKVKARITKEYNRLYGGEGPVLEVISIEPTEKIEDDVVYFS